MGTLYTRHGTKRKPFFFMICTVLHPFYAVCACLAESSNIATFGVASYPGSNYAGEGKRAWYLPFAVALDFTGICVNSILSVFFR